MDITNLTNEFIQKIIRKEIEIYNEASIQYELAIFLRSKLPDYKIQLERNVSYLAV
jgi:LEA14-like dessication related protein